MTVAPISTHIANGLARLLEQYKNKPKLAAILTSFIEQTQNSEDATHNVYGRLDVDLSEGEQLDGIGGIVGEDRGDKSDSEYRKFLYFRIGQNTSQGAMEKIISMFKLLTDASAVQAINLGDASIMLLTDGVIEDAAVNSFYTNMENIVAAGVRVDYIVTHDSALDFAFYGTNVNVTSKGFGSLTDAGAGGKFASLRRRRYPFAFAGNDLASVGFGSVRDSGIGGIFE